MRFSVCRLNKIVSRKAIRLQGIGSARGIGQPDGSAGVSRLVASRNESSRRRQLDYPVVHAYRVTADTSASQGRFDDPTVTHIVGPTMQRADKLAARQPTPDQARAGVFADTIHSLVAPAHVSDHELLAIGEH